MKTLLLLPFLLLAISAQGQPHCWVDFGEGVTQEYSLKPFKERILEKPYRLQRTVRETLSADVLVVRNEVRHWYSDFKYLSYVTTMTLRRMAPKVNWFQGESCAEVFSDDGAGDIGIRVSHWPPERIQQVYRAATVNMVGRREIVWENGKTMKFGHHSWAITDVPTAPWPMKLHFHCVANPPKGTANFSLGWAVETAGGPFVPSVNPPTAYLVPWKIGALSVGPPNP